MVLSICPDGNDTIIGRFITKDGERFCFDFDLVDPSESRLSREVQPASPKNRRYVASLSKAAALWFKSLT
jgi:hypothetical protein